MAGSLKMTANANVSIDPFTHKKCRRVVFDWVAASDGTVPSLPIELAGKAFKAVTIPGTGAQQPTNGYSIALQDPEAESFTLDALAGLLAARSNAQAQAVYLFPAGSSWPVLLPDNTYTLEVSGNTVAGATGRIVLFMPTDE